MEQSVKEEGKTMAIISYITIIGLIIAFVMNSSKNNEFAKFHIGQSLRISILGIILNVVVRFLPDSIAIVGSILSLGILVLWIIGLINAVKLKAEPVPVIGTIGG
ncbi:hypothetical protein FGM00_08435 [Aggregatimonas sangjinii]|uniref:Uncharacterized protein n=1 Tax=Aggregatimonas sangjinii TaxID=2583587 RepID=A0A5B7STE1_9FLAO|nr:hypothetical protein [Aggregatimonas sangjinii]QCX00130.1 hypothetical protein FGM00_08435 [Aggregatimonas sangjinii]